MALIVTHYINKNKPYGITVKVIEEHIRFWKLEKDITLDDVY